MQNKSTTRTSTAVSHCPECGMPSKEWTVNQGNGVEKNGRVYCCNGCAIGTGCVCMKEPKP
jgi:hypothetical protein